MKAAVQIVSSWERERISTSSRTVKLGKVKEAVSKLGLNVRFHFIQF